MRWIRVAVPTLTLMGAVVAAACSSDSTAPNQPVPPFGNYKITSLVSHDTTVAEVYLDGSIIKLWSPDSFQVLLVTTISGTDTVANLGGVYAFSTPDKVSMNSGDTLTISGNYTYNSTSGALAVIVPLASLRLNAQKQ